MFLRLHDGSLVSMSSISRVQISGEWAGAAYSTEVAAPTRFDVQVYDGNWHVLAVFPSQQEAEAYMLQLFKPVNG